MATLARRLPLKVVAQQFVEDFAEVRHLLLCEAAAAHLLYTLQAATHAAPTQQPAHLNSAQRPR